MALSVCIKHNSNKQASTASSFRSRERSQIYIACNEYSWNCTHTHTQTEWVSVNQHDGKESGRETGRAPTKRIANLKINDMKICVDVSLLLDRHSTCVPAFFRIACKCILQLDFGLPIRSFSALATNHSDLCRVHRECTNNVTYNYDGIERRERKNSWLWIEEEKKKI